MAQNQFLEKAFIKYLPDRNVEKTQQHMVHRLKSHASTFCAGHVVLFPPHFSLRSAACSYGNKKLLFLSWYEASTPRQPLQSGLNRTEAHCLTEELRFNDQRSKMLDNEEHLLENHPRELTQNPLKKIWMPHKNSHIAHRRGKRCSWAPGKCTNTGCDQDRRLRRLFFSLHQVYAHFPNVRLILTRVSMRCWVRWEVLHHTLLL